jgi:hypothetical protein
MQAFRSEEYCWWQVGEYRYDTFMVQTRTRAWVRRRKKLISISHNRPHGIRCRGFHTTIGLTEMTGDVL